MWWSYWTALFPQMDDHPLDSKNPTRLCLDMILLRYVVGGSSLNLNDATLWTLTWVDRYTCNRTWKLPRKFQACWDIYIYIHFFSVIYIELCRSTGNALWLATLPLTNFEVMAWSPGRQLSSRRRGFHFHVSWRVPSLCNIKGWNDFWKTIWIETSRKYMPKNTNPYVPLCHQRGHQRHRHVTGTSSFSTYLTPNEGSISSGDQRSTKNPCKWREYGWSANN